MEENYKKIQIFPVLLSREGPEDGGLVADGSNLPMGCVVAYAKQHNNSALQQHYQFHQLINLHPDEWAYYIENAIKNPGSIWLISSYMWNHDDNMAIAKSIKQADPTSIIIAGGPHIPGFEQESLQFFTVNPFIDITVRGEGEIALAEILEALSNTYNKGNLSQVSGITYRQDNDIIRTANRVRNRNLEVFPSPYLTGEYNHPSFNNFHSFILETNRGCPYGCTFCDWGSATLQKVAHFDLERLRQEIDLIGQRKTHHLFIADANFGAFQRDIEIATMIANTNLKYGYPKHFGTSFAKNATERLLKIIKILSEAGLIKHGITSIQTTDPNTLGIINRSNINFEQHLKIREMFNREELILSSELLIGLPGQTVESHKKDLQFIIDRKMMAVAFNVQLMPNAPMNEPGYRDKYQIETNENGYVIATSSFTPDEYSDMFSLFLYFQYAYVLGVMKYFIYFLQLDYGVPAMDLIKSLFYKCKETPNCYPLSTHVKDKLLTGMDPRKIGMPMLQWKTKDAERIFNHLDDYYAELFQFAHDQYGVEVTNTERQTIVAVQKGVMPSLGKNFPLHIEMPHDFNAYFKQIKQASIINPVPEHFQHLREFSSGQLQVSSLTNKPINNLALSRKSLHALSGWELRSPLRLDLKSH